jgi:6-phosphogluconolactonase
MMICLHRLVFAGILGALAMSTYAAATHVYIGTNTTTTSRGIYRFGLDADTGATTPVELAAAVKNPSFLALSPDRHHLFAVSEVSDFHGKRAGGVSSFTIDPTTGALVLVNQQPSGGAGPCHVSVSPGARQVAVANYGAGSIALLPVDVDGRLTSPTSVIQHTGSSINPQRQKEPHAHSVNFDASGRHLYAADLGIDKIKIYEVDPVAHTLKVNDPADAAVTPGAGPRHLSWHPNGHIAYVVTEMGNTITVFNHNAATGALTEMQTLSTLPPDNTTTRTFGAEVRVHPNGRWVYASNRGHDSIAVFDANLQTGGLTPKAWEPTGGNFPRHFNIDPTGQWLIVANQNSDNIVIFRINQQTGVLTRTSEITGIGKPVCVLFVPAT